MPLTFYTEADISCHSSRSVIVRFRDYLLKQGLVATGDPTAADVVLLDTCAFSSAKEDESVRLVQDRHARARADAKVIATGCMAAINPQRLRSCFPGEVFSPRDEGQLARILGLDGHHDAAPLIAGFNVRGNAARTGYWPSDAWLKLIHASHRLARRIPSIRSVPAMRRILDRSPGADPHAYIVTVAQGCMGSCTFCTIPVAKGRTASAPMGAIVERVREVVASGVTDLILTSEDTGAYGVDIGVSIVDLLGHIHNIDAEFRLYIGFYDPRWLRRQEEGLALLLARGRIRWLQVPIQSGSNRVLNLMRRGYRMDQVVPVLQRLRNACPEVAVTSQVIVGFPGETEEDFAATRDVLGSGLFDYADVFPFSNRPGTKAEKLPGHLPADLIAQRHHELRRQMLWQQARRLVSGYRRVRGVEDRPQASPHTDGVPIAMPVRSRWRES